MIPSIPKMLMQPMHEEIAGGYIDQANGGQWIRQVDKLEPFRGALLPISSKDLRDAPQGLYTFESMKLYTQGYTPRVGGVVIDRDGVRYTVKTVVAYPGIHPLVRCIVERKGAVP